MSDPVRISLVLSGGASLGAYQAGAVAALLEAVQATRARGVDVAVDSLGGASAGAIVSLLTAHAVVDGRDPVRLLHDAWVGRVDLDLLLGDSRAPLGFTELREHIDDVLEPFDDEQPREPQDLPLVLHVALTNLRGLRYDLRAPHREGVVPATTFVDWNRFVLRPRGGRDQLTTPAGTSPLDHVLASAANPGGFAPVMLDRSADAEGYRARGIRDLPDPATLWFSDGGLLQSEPVGRVISAAHRVSGTDGRRVVLLVDPRSEDPSGRYADRDAALGWMEGISRSLSIVSAQSQYDDLRRLNKDNSRLHWRDQLVDRLAQHLDGRGHEVLRDVLAHIDADRGGTASDHRVRSQEAQDVTATLRAVLDEIAGLTGKQEVLADVISPLALSDGDRVSALLAGEVLGDFGGFLSEELRHSDFLLGYDSAASWLDHSWASLEMEDDVHQAALDAVDAARLAPWSEANRGQAGVGDLPWPARLALARFAGHVVSAVADAVLPAPMTRWMGRAQSAMGATGSSLARLRQAVAASSSTRPSA